RRRLEELPGGDGRRAGLRLHRDGDWVESAAFESVLLDRLADGRIDAVEITDEDGQVGAAGGPPRLQGRLPGPRPVDPARGTGRCPPPEVRGTGVARYGVTAPHTRGDPPTRGDPLRSPSGTAARQRCIAAVSPCRTLAPPVGPTAGGWSGTAPDGMRGCRGGLVAGGAMHHWHNAYCSIMMRTCSSGSTRPRECRSPTRSRPRSGARSRTVACHRARGCRQHGGWRSRGTSTGTRSSGPAARGATRGGWSGGRAGARRGAVAGPRTGRGWGRR